MVAVTAMRRTCLVGGAASFAATIHSKLARYGLEAKEHFDEGHPPEHLPRGFDVYVCLYDVMRYSARYCARYKLQAAEEGLVMAVILRKESMWSQEFERLGIRRLAPVAGAALANEQAGERMPVVVREVAHPKVAEPKSREQLFEELEVIVKELREKHHLQSLIVDSEGKIEAECEVRTTERISRG